ncbi:MAG TPA: calcium/sodium antiporter [Bacteroidales bacterium]|nr:calcium/sodium antiporter [Bacteroidales bacterium]
MLNLLLLIGGFALLIYGANMLVNNASALAKSLKIPNIVIGLTIVAFGTSSPEFVVNVFAASEGNSSLALGNIVGSNLFNILLILGISAVIFPLGVKSSTTWSEIPLCLLSAVALFIMANDIILDKTSVSTIGRGDGVILLLFFSVFLAYNIHLARKGDISEELVVKARGKLLSSFLILAGLGLLVVGGRFIVQSAVSIAYEFGVPERIIALTIISAGTSLPELATSVVAAIKKNTDIAIGNIVGSNIFNVFFIMGVTALINPVSIWPGSNTDLVLNIFVSLLLFAFIFTGKHRRIEKVEGIGFLILYAGYLTFLIVA